MRTGHGIRAQATLHHRAQVSRKRAEVIGAGQPVPGGREDDGVRPGQDVGGRGCGPVGRCGAEVHHPGAVPAEHHQVRAELPVHQTGLMDGGDSGGAADGQRPDRRAGQRALGGDDFLQRWAGDVLGDQVGSAVLDAGVENAGHAERGDVARHPRFRDEPVSGGRVAGPGRAQERGHHRHAIHPLGQEDIPLRHVPPGEVIHPAGKPVAADAPGIAGPQGSDVGHPASSRIADVCVGSGLYPTHLAGFNTRHQGKLMIGVNGSAAFPPRCADVPRRFALPGAQHDSPESWLTCARLRDMTEFPA